MARRRISDLEGRDAYDLLGVPSTASEQEIRRAYRRAMFSAHPDRGGAEHLAKLINCAHDLLLSDRAAYDRHRRAAEQEASAPGEGDWDAWEAEATGTVTDPWADTDAGVGRPGRGADAPGAAAEPEQPWPDAPGVSSWTDRLVRTPVVLGGMLLVGVVIGVIAAMTGGPAPAPPAGARYVSGAAVPVSPAVTPTLPSPDHLGSPDHVCGVSSSRALWCSGANDDGQLGVGDTDDHSGPVAPVGVQGWRSVTTGQSHTCGITVAHALYCWGDNLDGQVGVPGPDDVAVPVQVGTGSWGSVAAYRNLTCGVRTDHRLYCWGTGAVSSATPRAHGSGATWASVAVEGTSVCAARPGHPKTCFPG